MVVGAFPGPGGASILGNKMKSALIILNIVTLVVLLLARSGMREMDLTSTWSVIRSLEQSQVISPQALAKHIPTNPASPERCLADMLNRGKGSAFLFTADMFLLLVNTIVIAVFWKPKKKGSASTPSDAPPR